MRVLLAARLLLLLLMERLLGVERERLTGLVRRLPDVLVPS